jgi:hypothetical protein
MKHLHYFALGLTLTLLMGATVYYQFSPGGALSGTWNSQNVNVGAGSPFIIGTLPVTAGGTGAATLTTHGVLLGQGTSAVTAVAAMAADTLLQGQGASANPAAVSVPNCGSATAALSYSTGSHTFGCQTISTGTTACTHGTATIAGTGFSGTANFHLFWEQCGDGTNSQVVLHVQGQGTSNATGFSIAGLTGLGIGPLNAQESAIFSALDNGTDVQACAVASGNTLSFFEVTASTACNGAWNSIGLKGVSAAGRAIVISYVMD